MISRAPKTVVLYEPIVLETPTVDLPSIPGYRLLEKLGEGGMGDVYRAQDMHGRPAAIKVLVPGTSSPWAAMQRESRLMRALHHPHVVSIFASGEIDDRCYLVMEYVSGSNLRATLAPGSPLPAERSWPVLNAVAQGLMHIHAQGVLHLDLKPENVLCGGRGEIKITDFGLALWTQDGNARRDLERVRGSIDYCPPEQRHGLPLDERADLFALATLAYELLTGCLPGRVYVPATARNPDLPAAVDAVLQRGLARDRDERYPWVADYHARLGSALACCGRAGVLPA